MLHVYQKVNAFCFPFSVVKPNKTGSVCLPIWCCSTSLMRASPRQCGCSARSSFTYVNAPCSFLWPSQESVHFCDRPKRAAFENQIYLKFKSQESLCALLFTLYKMMLVAKNGSICLPQICHFGIRIFWTNGILKNSRCKKGILISPFILENRRLKTPMWKMPSLNRRNKHSSTESKQRGFCTNR